MLLPIVGLALALSMWMHSERVGADAVAAESRRQTDAIEAQLHSPQVQEGLRLMEQIRQKKAATQTASRPATQRTGD